MLDDKSKDRECLFEGPLQTITDLVGDDKDDQMANVDRASEPNKMSDCKKSPVSSLDDLESVALQTFKAHSAQTWICPSNILVSEKPSNKKSKGHAGKKTQELAT